MKVGNMIKNSSSDSFATDVLSETAGRVTVFFYSDLITLCETQEEYISEVDSEHSDSMTFVRINFDENKELAAEYGILYGNIYMYFINGRYVSKFEKVSSAESLVKRISLDHDYSHLESL
jgi:thioredoxin 1